MQLLALNRPKMTVPLALSLAYRNAKEVEARTVVSALIHVCEIGHYTLDFLRELIYHEVNESESAETLMRGNTLSTKVLTHYALLVSKDTQYLYRVLNALIRTICNSTDWEIDPTHLPPGANIRENEQNLIAALEMFLTKIIRSASTFPPQLQHLCLILWEATHKKYPDHTLSVVGGFVLLRFLCPAILSPSEYGVWQETMPPHAKRPLMLISRTLMSLSNQQLLTITPDKEWLQPINDLISRNLTPMKNFFEQISKPLSEAEASERAVQLWPREREAKLFDALAFSIADSAIAITQALEHHWPENAEATIAALNNFLQLRQDVEKSEEEPSHSAATTALAVSPTPRSAAAAAAAASSAQDKPAAAQSLTDGVANLLMTHSSITPTVAKQLLSDTPPTASVSIRIFLTDTIVLRSLGLHRSFKTLLLTPTSTCESLQGEMLRKIATALTPSQRQDFEAEWHDFAVFQQTYFPPAITQLEPDQRPWEILIDANVKERIPSCWRLVLRHSINKPTAPVIAGHSSLGLALGPLLDSLPSAAPPSSSASSSSGSSSSSSPSTSALPHSDSNSDSVASLSNETSTTTEHQ